MKKIVSIIAPFDMYQTLVVYEDGNKLDVVSSTLENLNSTILGLTEKYEVYDINLIGSKKFLEGIANKIKEDFSLKYDNKELNIEINY